MCALRSLSVEHGKRVAALAAKYAAANGGAVLGMDVAGHEGSFPLNSPECAMDAGVRAAAENGVPITVHAGEWPDEKFDTIKCVKYAVDELRVNRIGHGIAIGRHPDILKRLAEKRDVTIEV